MDVYDIILFSAVRVPSLQSLGLAAEQITTVGLHLIHLQLIGMLLGGIVWGVLGDRRGRLSILFGSIFIYSAATLANAFVGSVEAYGFLRFIAGFGLAGEMGAGITLVNELMTKEKGGYGTMIIVTSGIFGGIAGGLVGNLLTWQTAHILGGLGGFLLLLLRMGVSESRLFVNIKNQKQITKGNLLLFVRSPALLSKYSKCLVGAPFWVFIGLFMALAPEIGQALNIRGPITAAWAILFFNIGLGFGDLLSSIISQIVGSRKKVILIYLVIAFMSTIGFLSLDNVSSMMFYFFCTILGLGSGLWAIFMMVVVEQFGTNMRATVTTSLPNFVRCMAIPSMAILSFLKPQFGILVSLEIVAIASIILAFVATCLLNETFATSLDFVEN